MYAKIAGCIYLIMNCNAFTRGDPKVTGIEWWDGGGEGDRFLQWGVLSSDPP